MCLLFSVTAALEDINTAQATPLQSLLQDIDKCRQTIRKLAEYHSDDHDSRIYLLNEEKCAALLTYCEFKSRAFHCDHNLEQTFQVKTYS
jgi:hypothetical protein